MASDLSPTTGPETTGSRRETRSRRARVGWGLAGALLLGIVLLAVFWDWNWFRPLVEAQASAALGRPVTLRHFDLKPGRQTVAIADGVQIANPTGFPADTPFATIARLAVTVDVMAYLHGRQIVVPSIVVDQPDIAAEQPDGHAPNWLFPALAPKPDAPAAPGPTDRRPADQRRPRACARSRHEGRFLHGHRDVAGRGRRGAADPHRRARARMPDSPSRDVPLAARCCRCAMPTHPYAIDLEIANGPTRVSLVGTVQDPMAFAGANLKLKLSGTDMELLFPLIGIPLPKTPSYEITGNLDYADRKIRFRNFSGRVGSSDIEGDIAVDPQAARPVLTADLRSQRVDLADLGGFIGSEPGRMSTPNQTPQQKQELARAEASPQLLPTKPINVPTLRTADIHLKYAGAKIIGRNMPFDRLSAVLDIDDGRIRLTPVSLGVGRGQIEGTIDLTPLSDKQYRLRSNLGSAAHRPRPACWRRRGSRTAAGRSAAGQ